MNTDIETIHRLITELLETNILIIVEGKKDKAALNALGMTNILILGTIYKTIEAVKGKEVALLVDLDLEGKKIYSKLRSELSQRGVRINNKLRHFLFKTHVRQIENLAAFLSEQKPE